MNKQEIFDTVSKFLLKQGHACKNEFGFCTYRGKNGDMCAVGALIPDELYSEDMDKDLDGIGTGVEYLCNHFTNTLPIWFHDNRVLLEALQDIHDTPSSWDSSVNMKYKLLTLAEDYNLSTGVLNDLQFEWENQND